MPSLPGLLLTVRRAVPGVAASTAGWKRFTVRCLTGIVLFDTGRECLAFGARVGVVAFEGTALTLAPEVIGSFEHRPSSSTSQSEIDVVDRQFIAGFQLVFATDLQVNLRDARGGRVLTLIPATSGVT